MLAFRSSGNLAAAYGVAVNSTMAITTVLAFNVARERGGWGLPAALIFLVGFLAIDLGFLGSNLLKIPDGGWLPLLIGAVLFTVMTTWRRGSILLAEQIANTTPSLETFIGRVTGERIAAGAWHRGIFHRPAGADSAGAAEAGAAHGRIARAGHSGDRGDRAGAQDRSRRAHRADALDAGFYRLVLRYGFMQGPNIPSDSRPAPGWGLKLDLDQVHYFIGHVDLLAGRKLHGMASWRDRLFARMASNTEDATAFYQIPVAQVMKVGLQVGI